MEVLLKNQQLTKSNDINDLVEELYKGGPGSGIKGHKTPKEERERKDEEKLISYIKRIKGNPSNDPDKTVEILNTETFGVVTPRMVQDWIDSGKVIIIPGPSKSDQKAS